MSYCAPSPEVLGQVPQQWHVIPFNPSVTRALVLTRHSKAPVHVAPPRRARDTSGRSRHYRPPLIVAIHDSSGLRHLSFKQTRLLFHRALGREPVHGRVGPMHDRTPRRLIATEGFAAPSSRLVDKHRQWKVLSLNRFFRTARNSRRSLPLRPRLPRASLGHASE